jgi:RND family efflux transporter MFP subunit
MKRRQETHTTMTVILAMVFSLSGCGGSTERALQTPETERGRHVAEVRAQIIPDEIEATGTVVAGTSAQVAARVMGTAIQVAVREGDRVRRGQVLVVLDDREWRAHLNSARAAIEEATAGREVAGRAVAAAQARAEVAEKSYQRFIYLRDQKSVSPQEFDVVEGQQRAARAALEQAQARSRQAEASIARAQSEARAAEEVAAYTHIVAPFDGIVVRRMVEAGSMVTPGMTLLVVEDPSRYRLEVTVTASLPGLVRGSTARIALDNLPGKQFQGKVVELEAGADPASHTVQAKIELPANPAIRSGLFGRAWFRRGERKAIVVPGSAVVERGQLRGVYVLDRSDIAQWRLVTLGAAVGANVEILSGLGEGERVVTDPGGNSLDGKKIVAMKTAGEEKS